MQAKASPEETCGIIRNPPYDAAVRKTIYWLSQLGSNHGAVIQLQSRDSGFRSQLEQERERQNLLFQT